MLGGIDPIIIFQFGFLAPSLSADIAKIPIVSDIPTIIQMPPIPFYLSEQATGILIDSESKTVDINTDTETNAEGTTPDVNQKGLAAVVEVNIVSKKDSLQMIILSSLIDLIFDKLTSKEYAISYLHGATTIFGGALHSFSVDQNASSDLLLMKIGITRGTKQPAKPKTVGAVERLQTAVKF